MKSFSIHSSCYDTETNPKQKIQPETTHNVNMSSSIVSFTVWGSFRGKKYQAEFLLRNSTGNVLSSTALHMLKITEANEMM